MPTSEYAFSADAKPLPSGAPQDLARYTAQNHFEPSAKRMTEAVAEAMDDPAGRPWEVLSHSVTLVGTQILISYLLRREVEG